MDPVGSDSSASAQSPYLPPTAYYNETTLPYADAWQYSVQQQEELYVQQSQSTQMMYATSAASPQSMASSSNTPSPQGQDSRMSMGEAQNVNSSDVETSKRSASPMPRIAGRKKAIDRNRRPCGNCSSSKRKCKIISTSPHLCERCRNHGLRECPPHISWTRRKESVNGSLSPQESDDRYSSSRSASPPYPLSDASPIPSQTTIISDFEYDYDAPLSCATSQQMQPWAQPMPAEIHASAGHYETHVSPPSVVVSQYPQGPFISVHDLRNLVCHVCRTPFDFSSLPITYDLTAASMPSPESSIPLQPNFAQCPPDTSTRSTYRSPTW